MNSEFKMVAKTMYGLEDILCNELEALGAKNIKKLVRAAEFYGDMRLLYRTNYCLRTALCILKPVATFTAKNEQELYNNIYQMQWEKYLNPDGTFMIDASVSSKTFNHSLYAAQKTKDAICDRFRKYFNVRPSVDKESPDLKIDLHISDHEVTVSFDSSGEKLFKRGYRQTTGQAPLNEVTAAGIIMMTGWQKDCNFLDPMCGSGTLAIEAAMYAMNIPAQYYRKKFAFQTWSQYNYAEWKREKEDANRKICDFDYEIWASDVSQEAVDKAETNIRFAKLHHDIHLFRSAMEEGIRPQGRTVIVTNPPYGERLEVDDIVALYERMGSTFKHYYTGCTAYVISSDVFALKKIGLKPSKKTDIYNGNLECKLYKFEMYEGSKKASKQQPEDKTLNDNIYVS
ncbi:MAG: RNA methyltransferase [Bacteroidales bacterium]|nr:RNA methyltransferase [Bacteroidales bacterium]